MATQRRYTEEEVAFILDRATSVQSDRRRHEETGSVGLTLRDLREIGHEVGIPEDVIDRAAAELDLPRPRPTAGRRFLGSTVGVGRTAELPRRLTEQEWRYLVRDLRDTFDAHGRTREDGDFKQWSNGNLQVRVEPTPEGARLRLRTVKGSAYPSLGWGVAMLVGAPVLWLLTAVAGATADPSAAVVVGTIGAGLFGTAKVSLPRWAETRERQMEDIVARLGRTMEAGDASAG
jgi:hypothetical protein